MNFQCNISYNQLLYALQNINKVNSYSCLLKLYVEMHHNLFLFKESAVQYQCFLKFSACILLYSYDDNDTFQLIKL